MTDLVMYYKNYQIPCILNTNQANKISQKASNSIISMYIMEYNKSECIDDCYKIIEKNKLIEEPTNDEIDLLLVSIMMLVLMGELKTEGEDDKNGLYLIKPVV